MNVGTKKRDFVNVKWKVDKDIKKGNKKKKKCKGERKEFSLEFNLSLAKNKFPFFVRFRFSKRGNNIRRTT